MGIVLKTPHTNVRGRTGTSRGVAVFVSAADFPVKVLLLHSFVNFIRSSWLKSPSLFVTVGLQSVTLHICLILSFFFIILCNQFIVPVDFMVIISLFFNNKQKYKGNKVQRPFSVDLFS